MSLRALRLRIIITYLHYPKHSKGLEPSMDDKEGDKRQCYMIITNTLTVRGEERSFCCVAISGIASEMRTTDAPALRCHDALSGPLPSIWLLSLTALASPEPHFFR